MCCADSLCGEGQSRFIEVQIKNYLAKVIRTAHPNSKRDIHINSGSVSEVSRKLFFYFFIFFLREEESVAILAVGMLLLLNSSYCNR